MSCREGIIDSPEHTISSCTRWRDERDTLTRVIGIDLDLPTIIKKMLDSKEAWKAMIAFSKRVMLIKENEKRARQAQRSRSRSLSVRNNPDDT